MMNFHTIFFDEKFWEDPNVFRPERFLDDNGHVIKSKEERILAFGSGRLQNHFHSTIELVF